MKVFLCSTDNGSIKLCIWEGTYLDFNQKATRGLVFTMMTPLGNTSGIITSDQKLVDVSGKANYGTTTFALSGKEGDTFQLQSANLYTLTIVAIPEATTMPVVTSTPRQPTQLPAAPTMRPSSGTNPAQDELNRQNQRMLDYMNGVFR